MISYEDVEQAMHDGASAAEIEAMLRDERAALTDAQIDSLREDLQARHERQMASEIAGEVSLLRPDLGGGESVFVEARERIVQGLPYSPQDVIESLDAARAEWESEKAHQASLVGGGE